LALCIQAFAAEGQTIPVQRSGNFIMAEAERIEQSQPARSMELAAEALALAIKEQNEVEMARCYLLLGRLHLNNGNKERAAELLEKASLSYGKLQNAAAKAESDRLLALALEGSGKLEKAAVVQKNYMNSSAISKKDKAKAINKNAEILFKKGLKEQARKELEGNLNVVQRDTVTKLELMNQLQGIYGQSGDTTATLKLAQENIGFLSQSKSVDAATYAWKFGDALLSSGNLNTSLNVNEQLLWGALNNNNHLVARQAYLNLPLACSPLVMKRRYNIVTTSGRRKPCCILPKPKKKQATGPAPCRHIETIPLTEIHFAIWKCWLRCASWA
jgi:tetratricopeptide (TPR) repeat protein